MSECIVLTYCYICTRKCSVRLACYGFSLYWKWKKVRQDCTVLRAELTWWCLWQLPGMSGRRTTAWDSCCSHWFWSSTVYCAHCRLQLPRCTWQRQLWQGNVCKALVMSSWITFKMLFSFFLIRLSKFVQCFSDVLVRIIALCDDWKHIHEGFICLQYEYVVHRWN